MAEDLQRMEVGNGRLILKRVTLSVVTDSVSDLRIRIFGT